MSSNGFKMCDSSEGSTTPNAPVSTSGPGKQISTQSINSSQNNGQPNYFQNLSHLPVSSTGGGMQGGLQHNSSTIQNHNNMIMGAHQQHHVPIHHQANPYVNQHLQHQLMEGHHHHQQQAHQMNLSMNQQQGNAHQFSNMPFLPPSQIPHPNAHSNSQSLMPFGMNFPSNMSGNGNQFINNQMGTFPQNNQQQLGNQQQANQHNLQQQAPCFMSHACIQHQSIVAALNAPRSSSSSVGWMSPHASSVPISNTGVTTSSALSTALASLSSTKVPASNILHPINVEDTKSLPGGLEHVWKKIPVECQKLMTPQDIPDSARQRGYFTVFELLQLKRALVMRYEMVTGGLSAQMTTPVINNTPAKKEEGKRGSKKGSSKNNNNSQVAPNTQSSGCSRTGQGYPNKHQEKQTQQQSEQREEENERGNMEHDLEDSAFGEQMIAIASIKNEEIAIHTDMPPITAICVAGAVKDAMSALMSDDSNPATDGDEEGTEAENDNDDEQNGQNGGNSGNPMTNGESVEGNGASQNTAARRHEAGITGEELAMLPALPPISDILPKKRSSAEDLSSSRSGTMGSTAEDEQRDMIEEERQKQLAAALVPITSMTTSTSPPPAGTRTVHITTSGNPFSCCGQQENRSSIAVPPFRTSTLVLKLLQIGTYCIRSFSSTNPNRLRVMFNTSRMIYECQLPIIRPHNPIPGSHLMRKVLTIDIGFEQISLLKFGPDSLYMRVEGTPLLTLSHCPALEEPPTQVLTPADEVLLDQIEKGQLKLSPCHQLYFLNERLVQQLESQFREHPRFRHLLYEDPYGQPPFAQKRMRPS